jgi:protocatechuate 3,4-dioxygenase, alpha subunit
MTTPSQTVGPFFGFGLPYDDGPRIVPEWHPAAITIYGQVFDGEGEPVPDALVEIWQVDADGLPPAAGGAVRRDRRGFSGFGRSSTDSDGAFWFSTVRPGQVAGSAPHAAILVFARGLLKPVASRIYFPEDTGAHTSDPVLSLVDPARRQTLVAVREADRQYRFDVRLQGENETVFFAM